MSYSALENVLTKLEAISSTENSLLKSSSSLASSSASLSTLPAFNNEECNEHKPKRAKFAQEKAAFSFELSEAIPYGEVQPYLWTMLEGLDIGGHNLKAVPRPAASTKRNGLTYEIVQDCLIVVYEMHGEAQIAVGACGFSHINVTVTAAARGKQSSRPIPSFVYFHWAGVSK